MNKKISIPFIIFLAFSFTVSVLPSFGELRSEFYPKEEPRMLSAEEFAEIIDKFARDGDYVQEHVNFTITDGEYYSVYGGLANGDPEEVIKIFNHPDYPFNVFDNVGNFIHGIDTKRKYESKFNQLFVNEIISYEEDDQNKGIIVIVNKKYANQENYDFYEGYIREVGSDLPIKFKVQQSTDVYDVIVPVMFFVVATCMLIILLVKKNKI